MYSFEQEQDHHAHAAAARTRYDSTGYLQAPCAAGRSLQLSPHHQRAQVDPPVGVQQQPPRRANNKKKHGARPPSSSRRGSSTTVVATDVANFRTMVQELTGFPPAAIFRPLPRRVHAVSSNPFTVAAAGHQQGCGAELGRGHGSSETATNTAGSSLISLEDARAVQPVFVLPDQFASPGVFDGLPDIGSPVFDSWGDLSIE